MELTETPMHDVHVIYYDTFACCTMVAAPPAAPALPAAPAAVGSRVTQQNGTLKRASRTCLVRYGATLCDIRSTPNGHNKHTLTHTHTPCARAHKLTDIV